MASGRSERPTDDLDPVTQPSGGSTSTVIDEAVAAVALVFTSFEPTRDDLVTHALRNRVRPSIITTLRALPNRRYRNVRQLRADLDRIRR